MEHAKQAKEQLGEQKIKEESAHLKKIAAERERNKQKLMEWKRELKQHKEQLSQQTLMQQAADEAKQKDKEDARRVSYPTNLLYIINFDALHFQLAIKEQISQYTLQKAQEVKRQQKLLEEQRKEEMHNRKLANEETKKLAERVKNLFF